MHCRRCSTRCRLLPTPSPLLQLLTLRPALHAAPLALASLLQLQFTDGPVSTKDLTRSFGWDTSDAFQQHDVHELYRILCEKLEEKLKVGQRGGWGGWVGGRIVDVLVGSLGMCVG